MAAGVRVQGLRETARSLERMGVQVADLKAAFIKIGQLVVHDSKTLAPVRTGRLVNTIKASKTKNKAVVRAGSARVPYAGVIHYGGYNHITAQPFLTKAVERQEKAAVRVLEDELGRLIRKLDLR